ncbi:hypothetical protein QA601_10280 [Chitinispirillales bacterium ANBcel5]|uniref:hypothetical protein n=1 Tax=Cellulosispirillum alkaliphilum TaxID=3039283 RepID=UPI002A54B65E|nr:hypothetical protein [Chitinispirillales bacterium ANBcel5]
MMNKQSILLILVLLNVSAAFETTMFAPNLTNIDESLKDAIEVIFIKEYENVSGENIFPPSLIDTNYLNDYDNAQISRILGHSKYVEISIVKLSTNISIYAELFHNSGEIISTAQTNISDLGYLYEGCQKVVYKLIGSPNDTMTAPVEDEIPLSKYSRGFKFMFSSYPNEKASPYHSYGYKGRVEDNRFYFEHYTGFLYSTDHENSALNLEFGAGYVFFNSPVLSFHGGLGVNPRIYFSRRNHITNIVYGQTGLITTRHLRTNFIFDFRLAYFLNDTYINYSGEYHFLKPLETGFNFGFLF